MIAFFIHSGVNKRESEVINYEENDECADCKKKYDLLPRRSRFSFYGIEIL